MALSRLALLATPVRQANVRLHDALLFPWERGLPDRSRML
jgi:hypothetical protein